jgi:predicted ribonuclease YlaK
LEHIKGLTFDNSFIIVDEAEDLTRHEIKSIMTRLGHNSKLVIMGDMEQSTENGCKYSLRDTIDSFVNADLTDDERKMFATIDLDTSLRSDFVNLVLKVLNSDME